LGENRTKKKKKKKKWMERERLQGRDTGKRGKFVNSMVNSANATDLGNYLRSLPEKEGWKWRRTRIQSNEDTVDRELPGLPTWCPLAEIPAITVEETKKVEGFLRDNLKLTIKEKCFDVWFYFLRGSFEPNRKFV
jgi:hypothetical protein